ncbi:efflux RND transporter permease subunit [Haloferacaceae archaeon DSL9]
MTGSRPSRPIDYQRGIDWVDDQIVTRPGRIILVFLVLSGVFAVGFGNVDLEAGTEQFAEDVEANEALERINTEFSRPFEPDRGTTQLIQRDRNVLSKPALVGMLTAQERLEEREGLRVQSTSSAASVVARTIDPEATTVEDQRRAVERATTAQIESAVRENADNPALTGTLSNDFNERSASASATIGVVEHEVPGTGGQAAGQGGESPLTPIQVEARHVVDTVDADITVFGSGIIASEFSGVIGDALLIVVPAAVLCIVFFLTAAYRDLVDLLIGGAALVMTIVWTFGFLGIAGIPFNQIMIAVPPLLLAVGIDFGIHGINRYREERTDGHGIDHAMRRSTDQLLVAFFIVTGTTAIGFLANLSSDLIPIRDFGVVAAIGIVFTFLIFGIFLPALKIWIDRRRDGTWYLPTFSQRPLGAEGSRLASVLRVGVAIAERGPRLFLALVLVATLATGAYATGVDTSFSDEDFLPPEDVPAYLAALPEPFTPSEYTVVSQLSFLEDRFQTTQGGTATIYLDGRLTDPTALESIHRAGERPPDSFVQADGRADETSIVTVIQDHADRDAEFRELVERSDRNGNGVPDRNLDEVYDALFDSAAGDEAAQYLADDRRSARVDYAVRADASDEEITADAQRVADRFRGTAIATGDTVVFEAISDLIFRSAIVSLAVALAGTLLFLVAIYWIVEGYPSLGAVNAVPIGVAVAAIAGSMRVLGISFNAFTATILALTIGLGIDYSVHMVHRFIDERQHYGLVDALDRTVRGTGGALAGSMLTTASGIGVLVLSVLDVLGQFGVLTALSVIYAFLVSIVVLPSVLVIWDGFVNDDATEPMNPGSSAREVRR